MVTKDYCYNAAHVVVSVGNVTILQLWGDKSEPVIQFLHFFFCVGAAVIPFMMKPFLNEAHDDSRNETAQANLSSNCESNKILH